MATLEELWMTLERAKTAYFAAKDAYEAKMIETHRFKVGDIIQKADGELAKVTSVFIRFDKVAMHAVKQLNDGRFGRATVPFWKGQWDGATLYERPERPE